MANRLCSSPRRKPGPRSPMIGRVRGYWIPACAGMTGDSRVVQLAHSGLPTASRPNAGAFGVVSRPTGCRRQRCRRHGVARQNVARSRHDLLRHGSPGSKRMAQRQRDQLRAIRTSPCDPCIGLAPEDSLTARSGTPGHARRSVQARVDVVGKPVVLVAPANAGAQIPHDRARPRLLDPGLRRDDGRHPVGRQNVGRRTPRAWTPSSELH